MRVLNKRQKKLLDEWFDKNLKDNDTRWKGPEDLGAELIEKLEQINDHETLFQNINRYMMDKVMEEIFTGDK